MYSTADCNMLCTDVGTRLVDRNHGEACGPFQGRATDSSSIKEVSTIFSLSLMTFSPTWAGRCAGSTDRRDVRGHLGGGSHRPARCPGTSSGRFIPTGGMSGDILGPVQTDRFDVRGHLGSGFNRPAGCPGTSGERFKPLGGCPRTSWDYSGTGTGVMGAGVGLLGMERRAWAARCSSKGRRADRTAVCQSAVASSSKLATSLTQ